MPCGLPLAVHRHASIAGVMLTRFEAFLWLLGSQCHFLMAAEAAYPRDKSTIAFPAFQPSIATGGALFTRRETSCVTSASFISLLSLHIVEADPVTACSTQRLRDRRPVAERQQRQCLAQLQRAQRRGS